MAAWSGPCGLPPVEADGGISVARLATAALGVCVLPLVCAAVSLFSSFFHSLSVPQQFWFDTPTPTFMKVVRFWLE